MPVWDTVWAETVIVPLIVNWMLSVVKQEVERMLSLLIWGLSYPELSTAVKRVRDPRGRAAWRRINCRPIEPATADIKEA